MAAPAAYAQNDTVPLLPDTMSARLAAHVSRAGLTCLKTMLEHAGVLTYACLGALCQDELAELCLRVRAAGFGIGHARGLRELCGQACAEAQFQPADGLDEASALPSSLSPILYFRLARRGLHQLEPILARCGVRTIACLGKLSEEEREELADAITAAGFDAGLVFREIRNGAVTASAGPLPAVIPPSSFYSPGGALGRLEWQTKAGIASSVAGSSPVRFDSQWGSTGKRAGVESDDTSAVESPTASAERPTKRARVEAGSVLAPGDAGTPPRSHLGPAAVASPHGVVLLGPVPRDAGKAESAQEGFEVNGRPGLECLKVKDEQPEPDASVSNVFSLVDPDRVRMSSDSIDEVVRHLKAAPAQIVRYRDRGTGKLQEARIPTAVMALLRLRASCTGKPVSDLRLARVAMDVMEEQAYDPVRAFASLSPKALLCPSSAVRVMGAGFCGTVFMEEQTGTVVKVMLEDFAEREYEVFCAFANAGLAARPIGLHGPQAVPGGSLYSIHMEAITHTLQGVLHGRLPQGPRRGLNPPNAAKAHRIGEAIVRAFQGMWDNGLVHGDLHMENIALRDPESSPLVQLLDFGRSGRNVKAAQSAEAEALRAGHDYDVFRLLEEIFNDYDVLQERTTQQLKDCEKELAEFRRRGQLAWTLSTGSSTVQGLMSQVAGNCKGDPTGEFVSQLHDARQISGLQAYIADEPKSLAEAEAAYNIILAVVVQYACEKLDLAFNGDVSLSNRRMRQAISKRRGQGYKAYFRSKLFWGSSGSSGSSASSIKSNVRCPVKSAAGGKHSSTPLKRAGRRPLA